MGSLKSGNGFRLDIQGLRAIAVALVVFYHAGVPGLSGGYIGVDVFFVISGFLISSHLLELLRGSGNIDFMSFYARRIRRILPVSFFVLAATLFASFALVPPMYFESIFKDFIATAVYLPNMWFAFEGTDYLAETAPSPLQHYWSLGVEEQFYFFWPLLLLCFWRIASGSRRVLWGGIVTVFLCSLALSQFMLERMGPWAFFGLPTRAWELVAGCLAAMLLDMVAVRRFLSEHEYFVAIAGWLSLLGLVCLAFVYSSETTFPGLAALPPVVLSMALLVLGARQVVFGPLAILRTPIFQLLGLLSYSIYLWHWPVLVISETVLGDLSPLMVFLALLATFALSFISYKYIETPFRFGQMVGRAGFRRVILSALMASLVMILLSSGFWAYSKSRPISTKTVAEAYEVTMPPVFSGFVPVNIRPALREISKDNPVIYKNGCHLSFSDTEVKECVYGDAAGSRNYVLFGDSHAAQWFPALDSYGKQSGARLHVFTKSSCQSVGVVAQRKGLPYPECEEWKTGVMMRMRELSPDAVIISNYRASSVKGADFTRGLQELVSALPVSTRLIMILDTPDLMMTPALCASGHLNNLAECGLERHSALPEDLVAFEKRAAKEAGVALLDLNDYICGSTWCFPIAGDIFIYRDAHHLTTTFSAALAKVLGEHLEDALHGRARE